MYILEINSLLCYDFLDYLIFRYSPTYIATDISYNHVSGSCTIEFGQPNNNILMFWFGNQSMKETHTNVLHCPSYCFKN